MVVLAEPWPFQKTGTFWCMEARVYTILILTIFSLWICGLYNSSPIKYRFMKWMIGQIPGISMFPWSLYCPWKPLLSQPIAPLVFPCHHESSLITRRLDFLHGVAGRVERWIPSEYCNQWEFYCPPATSRRRWGTVDREEFPPCPGSSSSHYR